MHIISFLFYRMIFDTIELMDYLIIDNFVEYRVKSIYIGVKLGLCMCSNNIFIEMVTLLNLSNYNCLLYIKKL